MWKLLLIAGRTVHINICVPCRRAGRCSHRPRRLPDMVNTCCNCGLSAGPRRITDPRPPTERRVLQLQGGRQRGDFNVSLPGCPERAFASTRWSRYVTYDPGFWVLNPGAATVTHRAPGGRKSYGVLAIPYRCGGAHGVRSCDVTVRSRRACGAWGSLNVH